MLPARMLAGTMCLLASTAAFAEDPLPRAKPEEAGFSAERLARIGTVLNADIEAGRIPGAVIAIARHGKLVMFEAYGFRDKEAKVAMTTDTIFKEELAVVYLSAAPGPLRWHYRQKINALVYQAMVE